MTESPVNVEIPRVDTGTSEAAPLASEDLDIESLPTPTEYSEHLPLDQVFELLKNRRRRRVLAFLLEADGQVTLSELAERIAALENDKAMVEITSTERKRVYVGLYQCHLPKMDRMGAIQFNKPRGTVEIGPNAPILYEYLQYASEPTDSGDDRVGMVLSLSGIAFLVVALILARLVAAPVLEIAVFVLIAAFSGYVVYSRR